jgi:hypothetical protein
MLRSKAKADEVKIALWRRQREEAFRWRGNSRSQLTLLGSFSFIHRWDDGGLVRRAEDSDVAKTLY